ncbi:MAG: hypothetical protein WCL15_06630 [Actinomycetes bacterium]
MVIGLVIFIAFTFLLAVLIIAYDRPTKARRKITGRGGDFAE